MKITCPGCATSYSVDSDTFPAEGRSVRCARCKIVWHAVPYVPDRDILPPDGPARPPSAPGSAHLPDAVSGRLTAEMTGARLVADGPEGETGLAEVPELDIEAAAAARARQAARDAGGRPRVRRRARGGRGVEAFVVGVLIAALAAAAWYRDTVVRALPSAAGLYALAGLPVNLRGLEFDKVSQRRDFEDGVPVLIIEGEIVNIDGRAVPVPALRFALRGPSGDEIYAWTMEPRQKVIEPSQAMSFRTRLASPPRGAHDVLVRFIERDRRVVELSR